MKNEEADIFRQTLRHDDVNFAEREQAKKQIDGNMIKLRSREKAEENCV